MDALVTPRLVLRRARWSDLDDMHKVLSNSATMTYWSTGPHDSESETETWLDAMIRSPPEESDDFVVESGGRVIGKLGAWRLPEIGFIFLPEYHGRGLATEAMAAFLRHVFSRPELTRLTADVDPRNAASLTFLQRHGFVRTGYGRATWNTHIGVCDSVYLELDRTRCALF